MDNDDCLITNAFIKQPRLKQESGKLTLNSLIMDKLWLLDNDK